MQQAKNSEKRVIRHGAPSLQHAETAVRSDPSLVPESSGIHLMIPETVFTCGYAIAMRMGGPWISKSVIHSDVGTCMHNAAAHATLFQHLLKPFCIYSYWAMLK